MEWQGNELVSDGVRRIEEVVTGKVRGLSEEEYRQAGGWIFGFTRNSRRMLCDSRGNMERFLPGWRADSEWKSGRKD